MIYTDRQLFEWAKDGGIKPFDHTCINPASFDLRLGNTYRTPILVNNHYQWSEQLPIPEEGLLLRKGDFVLCHSKKYVQIPINAVAKLFLKSTTGRRGLEHLHAGYADPGFQGQWTLELYSHWPGSMFIRAGERLLQMTIEECSSDALKSYSDVGHYQDQSGPTLPYIGELSKK